MQTIKELILASQSVFRRRLLDSTGLRYRAEVSGFDEDTITDQNPGKMALARALGKASEVASRNPGCLAIGADQVLAFQGQCIGKAKDRGEAFKRLKSFSGQSHELVNGLCLVFTPDASSVPKIIYQATIIAIMHARILSDEVINAYLDHCSEWQGVVGCYQYESLGIHFFEKTAGDYSTIIGLPLLDLLQALRAIGIDALIQPQGPWQSPIL